MTAILMVFNAYLNRGGEDEVFEAEANLLESHGHQVTRFRVEPEELVGPSVMQRVRLAVNAVWSRQYFRRFGEMLSELRPDLVHFQNTFPLISPSAYAACQKAGVPVVQTLHNYRTLCPNAVFYRNEQPCEDCLGRTVPWSGMLHGCYRGSRSQSAVVAAMLTTHRLRGTWSRDVDGYIALTQFARQKFIQGGLPADRIAVKPNFLDLDPGVGAHDGDFALFVGRLAANKGVETLLRAWQVMENPVGLRIVGDGPLAEAVRAASRANPALQYEGRLERRDVLKLMGQARALIFPSTWYECFPVTIVEAFANGLPVLASRLGSMAEIIEDGRNGLHFAPGDAPELAARVRWAWDHPEELQRIGMAGRREYETRYTAERNYHELIQIYDQASSGVPGRC